MPLENALDFIKEYEEIIEDQSDYLSDTDWSSIGIRKDRRAEYELHYKILSSFIARAKNVLMEAGEGALENKKIRKFADRIAKELSSYIERVNDYFRAERWQEYEGPDAAERKAEELDLQDDMLKHVIKVREELAKLNLNNDKKNVILPIYGSSIISLSMKATIEQRYPEIKAYTKQRKQ